MSCPRILYPVPGSGLKTGSFQASTASALKKVIIAGAEIDNPQPAISRDTGGDAAVIALKLREWPLLGDEPPQRAAVSDRPDWIASAGLPHSVFGGTGAHRPPLPFVFKLPTEGLMNSTTNSRRRPEVASVRVA